MARLEALQKELNRMVHECSGGRTADCRVREVLRNHSEYPPTTKRWEQGNRIANAPYYPMDCRNFEYCGTVNAHNRKRNRLSG